MGRLITQQPNGKWALISTCEAADTFFTDPDRLWDWKKAIQWEYLRNGNKTDTWKYIKENIDPSIDDIAAAMRFNDEGEWID